MQGGDYGSALIAASYAGNEEVVELLLNRGADINVQGSYYAGYYGNALHKQAVFHSGYKEIAKPNKVIDINANTLDRKDGNEP
ncbi:hypothetical protein ABW20_dc0103660 [Dactylellina cionopaga]|nr:hypothetical protein ABW20_dc0103660 [Dactylellina cionopaga]